MTSWPLPSMPIAFQQLPTPGLFRLISATSSHPSKILDRRKIKQLCWIWWGGISLPVRLHTAILLILLTQRNKSTAANPALQITACKAPRKASSIFSFRLSSGLSPLPADPSYSFYVLQFRPWFPGLLYSLLFHFQGIWNPSLHIRQNTIPTLHAMCQSLEMQGLSLIGETPVFTQGTQQNLCFSTLTSILTCAPKKGTGHGNLRILFGTVWTHL